MLRSVLIASVAYVCMGIPMNCVDFGGGLRLTVNVNPDGQSPQESLLDTGSSTLAFCDSSLETPLQSVRTEYVSCNLYGSGNEGYWGFFYEGKVDVGSDLHIDSAYYSIMHQYVSMPCGNGLQGIFGVAFKQLDQAAYSPSALDWPQGGVGSCPRPSKDFVGPLMSYLKQDTPEGRLGIYWNGAVGSSAGELYVGPSAESNPHYNGNAVQTATLGETGWYDIQINQVSFAGQNYPVTCDVEANQPCLVDTGTPIMFVPNDVYQSISNGQTGTLEYQLAGPDGATTLRFDAQALAQNQYIQPFQEGGPYILGLPLWAFYYTVFNVDAKTISFVEHTSHELAALHNVSRRQNMVVV